MAESPKYFVTKKQKEIEIRKYSGYIQAEVTLASKDYKLVIESGFNVVSGYIFANHISREKLP